MFEPKPISRDAIPAALAKAERYRLLNEPGEAESICLDILQIEPANQEAIVTLLLHLRVGNVADPRERTMPRCAVAVCAGAVIRIE